MIGCNLVYWTENEIHVYIYTQGIFYWLFMTTLFDWNYVLISHSCEEIYFCFQFKMHPM